MMRCWSVACESCGKGNEGEVWMMGDLPSAIS